MERTVMIDGRAVRFRASAGIPRLYRIRFKRDLIQDMATIQSGIKKSCGASVPDNEEDFASFIPLETLTLFENLAYLMARHADPAGVPDSVEAWLDGFETFSIYQVFPVIRDMWEANLQTSSRPKKKSRRRRGK